MTIIAASRRPTFAVIAVERLWHSTDGETGYDAKLVIHATLPLAIGTAGIREMPDGRLVTEHLTELIAPLTDPGQLERAAVGALIVDHFLEPVREMRQNIGAENPSAHMDFYIALEHEGIAQMAVIRIHDEPAGVAGPVWIDAPAHIGDFYEQHGMLGGAYLYGDATWGVEQVVERLVHIVRRGIECDEQAGLPHRYAGGTIDVAIIRTANAEHRQYE